MCMLYNIRKDNVTLHMQFLNIEEELWKYMFVLINISQTTFLEMLS